MANRRNLFRLILQRFLVNVRRQTWFLCFLLCFFSLFTSYSQAQNLSIPDWVFEKVGKFITDTHLDQYGRLWVGTEEDGVWLFDGTIEGKLAVKHFTSKDGLGDNYVYAVTVDKQGRTWVGHLNHGVSVYNGNEWKNYDVVTGPLGERVFDISVNPKDGDVWMATSAGLARYSDQHDKWKYYTRANGLPSDQIETIAFNKEGIIYAGTQCDGLAIADALPPDVKWHTIKGPDAMPFSPAGKGLPGNQINDILVADNNDVYVGTSSGLAISKDTGRSWIYIRGKNLKSKLQQLYCPENYNTLRANIDYALKQIEQYKGISLLEDHITCLSEDPKGNIWIGYRTAGYEIYNPQKGKILCSRSDKKHIFDVVVSGIKQPVFGCFGEGLQKAEWPDKTYSLELLTEKNTHEEFISLFHRELPSIATPPSAESLKKMISKIESLPELEGQQVVYLGEDWITQGDWIGTYGRQYATLCAMHSPHNHNISYYFDKYDVSGSVGLHGNDVLRHWIHWLKTEDKRVLYNPLVGYRREAEWDDHGEVYSWDFDGPDVWIAVQVPEGIQKITLYFMNPNGHNSAEQNRDYIVEIKDYTDDLAKANFAPALARTRVHDFWGGVYKSFLVSGADKYLIKIDRNYCFNTLVQAVMIDQLEGDPIVKDDNLAWMCGVSCVPQKNGISKQYSDKDRYAVLLWEKLDNEYKKKNIFLLQRLGKIMAYRMVNFEIGAENMLDYWKWNLHIWNDKNRKEFASKTRLAWNKLLTVNPHLSDE